MVAWRRVEYLRVARSAVVGATGAGCENDDYYHDKRERGFVHVDLTVV